MLKNRNLKTCRAEGCKKQFLPYKTTDQYCSKSCAIKSQKSKTIKSNKPIKQFSKSRAKDTRTYTKKRLKFLSLPENQICFVDGCNKRATTIEHTKGRIGSNYLDVSTWKPCCLFHNLEFERNSELSNKYQESKIHKGKKLIK